MEFLGPVTTLARPHRAPARHRDLHAPTSTAPSRREVTRLQRIGFEVRAELETGTEQPWAQLTRGQADALELDTGFARVGPHAGLICLA